MTQGMKKKTIKAVLRNKVDAWLDSIEDKDLRDRCRKDAIVTGGSIASMLLGEKVSDYDVYFKRYQTVLDVAKYYVEKFKALHEKKDGSIFVEETKDVRNEPRIRIMVYSEGVADNENPEIENEIFDDQDTVMQITEEEEGGDQPVDEKHKPKYRPIYLSSNAITLSGKMQIVLRFWGTPEAIHKNYDFVHCTNYWMSETGELHLQQKALESLLSKNLIYQSSNYPLCSLFRLRKFIDRGWRINAGQILKIAMDLNQIDLNNLDNLEDQLTGVDVGYFEQVMESIRESEHVSGDHIEKEYLIEIINRMFGD